MNDGIRIEEVLERDGVYITTTSGISMYPMLRNKRDTVVIRPVSGRLKLYDVPLYRRGDSYVLHRVIRVLPDKDYEIRGDNCFATESVPEDAIIGVLTGFWRDDREIDMSSAVYRAYVKLWVTLHPVICIFKRIRSGLSVIYRKVFKGSNHQGE